MKKTLRSLSTLFILLALAGSAWALAITTSSGTYEAGAVDTLYTPDAMTKFDTGGRWTDSNGNTYSGLAAEEAWVESIIGMDITIREQDKTELTSSDWGTGIDAQDLDGDGILDPIYGFRFSQEYNYFLIKTGNVSSTGNDRFLYRNLDDLYWAVLNLNAIGISEYNISGVSHIDGVDPTAPVPEPATLMLLGSGLLGLAGLRRKSK